MNPVRVLLVDDSPVFLDAAANFLLRHAHVQVVGRARNGAEGVHLSRQLAPDLVLMDLAMPGMNGLAATREIKAHAPTTCVVIVTLHDDPEYRRGAIDARADGFVHKAQFGDIVLSLIAALPRRPTSAPPSEEPR